MSIIFKVLDVVGDVLDTVTDVVVDVVDWVVDDIAKPLVVGTLDLIKYAGENPIEAAAKLALTFASGGYYAFLIPLVDGAATLAKGGSINDALKATAISYAATKVGGKTSNYVSASLKEAGVGATVSSIITTGATKASVALVYGQDPLKAFLAGGVNAGVGAALAMIDTKLTNAVEGQLDEFDKPIIKGWEDLQDGVKDSISAALAAELDSGSFTADTMSGIIGKYTGVADTMEKFLKDNIGLNKGQAAMLTGALTQAATTALAGNPEMSGEAFFAKFDEYGMEKLKELADKPVDKFIDKLDGSYQETEAAAEALNTVMNKTAAAADGFNSTREELNGRIAEQTVLENSFEVAAAAYAANPSQATADAQNDAAAAYTVYADQLKIDYDNTYKPQMDAYTATYEEYFPQIEALDTAYKDANQYMISDIDNLSSEMKPVFTGMEKAVALTLRPGIDEDAYRKATGIGDDVDIYRHYLENQKNVDNIIITGEGETLKATLEVIETELSGVRPTAEDYKIDRTSPSGLPVLTIDELPALDDSIKSIPKLGVTNDVGGYDTIPNELLENTGSYDEASKYRYGDDAKLSYVKSIIGQFAVGIPENLAAMLTGAGAGATVAMNEIYDYFSPTGGYGRIDAAEMIDILMGTTPESSASIASKFSTESDLTAAIGRVTVANDANMVSASTSRLQNFTGDDSVIEKGTKYLGAFLEQQASFITDYVFSEEEQAILNASGLQGTTFNDLNFTGKKGSLEGLAGTVSNEIGGEVLDFLLKKNPWMIAASGTLNAGEAVTGAKQQSTQTVKDLFNAGELQKTDLYKEALAYYGGDEASTDPKIMARAEDKAKAFIASEVLRDSILKVSLVGATDVLLPGSSSGLIVSGLGRATSEGAQEVGESAIVLTSVNKILGTNLPIFEDAAGNFVMGTLSGGGTQVFGAVTDATKNLVVKGSVPPETDDTGGDEPPKVDTGFARDTWEAFNKASEAREGAVKAYSDTFNDWSGENTSTARDLISVLQGTTDLDAEMIMGIANVTYDSDITTRDEIGKAAKKANPDLIFTDDIAADLYEQFGGYVSDTGGFDIDTAVAEYIAPLSDAYEEAKRTALEGGKDVVWEDVKETVDDANTSYDEAKQLFADLGYTPTEEEIQSVVGEMTEARQKTMVDAYVNPRMVSDAEARQFFADQGYEPTDEEVAARVGQFTEKKSKTDIGAYVGPRMVSDAEARQFFADLGYENPTDEQVAQFVAQVSETEQADVIAKYVDLRQVTRDEVQAIADEEGLTLTDALAAAYVGQGVAKNFAAETLSGARKQYDPLATTEDEAAAFFADTNYTASPEEIADFVASKTEEIQKSAIGGYVDPRQMTAKEAKAFLSEIGYNPTDEEVAQFTGQLNDATYQKTQKVAIDEYVDPRYVDAGEVRAAYEKLGLVGVDQADIDKFVGQFDEKTQLEAVKDYVPVATTNVIRGIIGSPSVEDNPDTDADESKDATGIYAELEDGATRDEALEAALAKLTKDLGVTEDALLKEIGLTKDDLVKEIDIVAEDVADVKEDVTEVKEDVGDLADILGDAGVADDPTTEADETKDATGLFATIKAYEDAGFDRDTALQKAIDDVSTALGTSKTDLLTAIGETETSLTDTIGDVKTDLGVDIDAVAKLVGKPAREVTQVDIDFVADLIAGGNVTDELTLQYDVTGDGIVDILDQNLLTDTLQGTTDTALADTSIFDPATGLFLQQQTDTQTTQDMIQDMNTDITMEIDRTAKQQNFAELQKRLAESGDAAGQQVTVTPGEKVQLDYQYDIGGDSIFATEGQAGMFSSPFGGSRAGRRPEATSQFPTRTGNFAQGGQVEDENDRLLRLLGEM